MLISNAAIRQRSTVFALMLIIIVVGTYSYIALPRESTPDITVPYVLVITTYEGVASSDIESLITNPIERKLRGLKNVEEIRSVSAEGSSMITVEFIPDVDIDNALQWVRDKVDQAKGDLPDDLENDPQILEVNLAEFPVLMVAVSGAVPETILKGVAEELEEHLEEVPGVLDVVLTGGREHQVQVEIDPIAWRPTGSPSTRSSLRLPARMSISRAAASTSARASTCCASPASLPTRPRSTTW